MRRTKAEKIGGGLNTILMFFLMMITLYPFWHVIMYAFSDPMQALKGGIFLWPKGFSTLAFSSLMQSKPIFTAYGNTLFVTVVGTIVNMIMTIMLAYPLSIRRIKGRGVISVLVFFTMLFGGGMIPSYLLVSNLGLIDSHWALILPGAISAWNMFLMRNYFANLPDALEESARIDGANALVIMLRIVIPLSLPVIATVSLFYAVGHWNSYFNCVLYINARSKQVLQVYLRTILASTSAMDQLNGTNAAMDRMNLTEETMKMATIVVSVIPILLVYPFVQKYYVKGIMVGSIKG